MPQRHPGADVEDGRRADAAAVTVRRRHRNQALNLGSPQINTEEHGNSAWMPQRHPGADVEDGGRADTPAAAVRRGHRD